jgi:hypothetical protein
MHPPFSASGRRISTVAALNGKDNVATASRRADAQADESAAEARRDFSSRRGRGQHEIRDSIHGGNHWAEIGAEICIAEGSRVARTGGQLKYSSVQTAEKIPYGIKRHRKGGGARLGAAAAQRDRASQAVAVAAWQPPMKF